MGTRGKPRHDGCVVSSNEDTYSVDMMEDYIIGIPLIRCIFPSASSSPDEKRKVDPCAESPVNPSVFLGVYISMTPQLTPPPPSHVMLGVPCSDSIRETE